MKAIILAAGIGERLRPLTNENPKCMIKIGGRPIVSRMLSMISECGVKEIVMVVGYRSDTIIDHVEQNFPELAVKFVMNERYTLANILSLHLAREDFNDDIVIMDGDVLCSKKIFKRLIDSKNENCFLLDDSFVDTGEEMKLMARKGQVLSIARQVSGPHDLIGEGVGFLKLGIEGSMVLKGLLDEHVKAGHLDWEYEQVLDYLVKEIQVGYESVGGDPWTEIDFPEDIEKAEREILPLIEAG